MHQHLPSPVSYREDINGLRAYAVIAVLLFHFSLIGLPGGFAGVDVFFVISGYLMTAIVVGGHEKGNFSLLKFYMARARRILPALMVVIASLLALGWFWLPTPDYQALGSQSAYGLSFLSNIYYWRSAGYFDAAAHEKWLLHTWSLAVEAQFYVLYPVFIALIWRFWANLKAITLGVLTVLVLSLLLNLVATQVKPTAAFYLLPTRGWELAAGGLVFLLAKQGKVSAQIKAYGYWLGWLLMLASFALINDTLAWPGYWAILPVLGASLIILGQRENCKLTDNGLAQWLGDRSYSLYLWHWPLVVALYFAGLQSDWAWVAGAFVLSLLMAHLSYHWVEVPTRQYLSQTGLWREIVAIAAFGILIGLAAVTVKLKSFEGRLPEAVEIAANEATNLHPRRKECHDPGRNGFSPQCIHNDAVLGAILWGDSHAASAVGGLATAAESFGQSVMELSFSGCPAVFEAKSTPWRKNADLYSCQKNDQLIVELISNHQNSTIPIVVVSRLSAAFFGQIKPEAIKDGNYPVKPSIFFSEPEDNVNDTKWSFEVKNHIVKTYCELSSFQPTYVMRPIPEMGIDVPKNLSRNILFGRGREDIKITLAEYHERHKVVWEAQDEAAEKCGVKILDPLPYLCDDQYCYGSKNGRPLYYDDDHLSEYGNKFLVPMFEQVFKDQKQ